VPPARGASQIDPKRSSEAASSRGARRARKMIALGRQTKLSSWGRASPLGAFFPEQPRAPTKPLRGLSRKVNTEDGVSVITFMRGSTLN